MLRDIAKNVQKYTIDNSPLILTAIGVAGTITTAVLSARAGCKYTRLLENEAPDMPLRDRLEKTWPVLIPPIGSAVLTCGAIICANRIGTRRAAAMAAAYTISQEAFSEYKTKVIEKIGQKQEQVVRDEVAQDRIDRNPVSTREVIIAGGDVLFYDQFSDRYFKSDMETVKKAQNDTNYQILSEDGYASLGDFYNRIGLDGTAYSEEVGWTSEKKLEVLFSTTLSDDQRPCISISFRLEPVRGFDRLH